LTPKKLIFGGSLAIAIVVSLFLSSESWAPRDSGIFIVLLFPICLAAAGIPVLGGTIYAMVQLSRVPAQRSASALVGVVVGLVVVVGLAWYIVFYFTA
jgi:hypothetical protein